MGSELGGNYQKFETQNRKTKTPRQLLPNSLSNAAIRQPLSLSMAPILAFPHHVNIILESRKTCQHLFSSPKLAHPFQVPEIILIE